MKLHLPIGLRRALLAVLHPVVIASALAAASAAAFAQESTNSSSSSGGTQTIDPIVQAWIVAYNENTTGPKIYVAGDADTVETGKTFDVTSSQDAVAKTEEIGFGTFHLDKILTDDLSQIYTDGHFNLLESPVRDRLFSLIGNDNAYIVDQGSAAYSQFTSTSASGTITSGTTIKTVKDQPVSLDLKSYVEENGATLKGSDYDFVISGTTDITAKHEHTGTVVGTVDIEYQERKKHREDLVCNKDELWHRHNDKCYNTITYEVTSTTTDSGIAFSGVDATYTETKTYEGAGVGTLTVKFGAVDYVLGADLILTDKSLTMAEDATAHSFVIGAVLNADGSSTTKAVTLQATEVSLAASAGITIQGGSVVKAGSTDAEGNFIPDGDVTMIGGSAFTMEGGSQLQGKKVELTGDAISIAGITSTTKPLDGFTYVNAETIELRGGTISLSKADITSSGSASALPEGLDTGDAPATQATTTQDVLVSGTGRVTLTNGTAVSGNHVLLSSKNGLVSITGASHVAGSSRVTVRNTDIEGSTGGLLISGKSIINAPVVDVNIAGDIEVNNASIGTPQKSDIDLVSTAGNVLISGVLTGKDRKSDTRIDGKHVTISGKNVTWDGGMINAWGGSYEGTTSLTATDKLLIMDGAGYYGRGTADFKGKDVIIAGAYMNAQHATVGITATGGDVVLNGNLTEEEKAKYGIATDAGADNYDGKYYSSTNLISSRAITLTAEKNITLKKAKIEGGNVVTLNAKGGNVSLSGGSSITSYGLDLKGAGTFVMGSGDLLKAAADEKKGLDGHLTMEFGKDITIGSGAAMSSVGNISITSTGGSISITDNEADKIVCALETEKGFVTLSGNKGITLTDMEISAKGDVTLTAEKGSITTNSDVTSTEGKVSMSSGHNISLKDIDVNADKDVSLTSTTTVEIPSSLEDMADLSKWKINPGTNEISGVKMTAGGNVSILTESINVLGKDIAAGNNTITDSIVTASEGALTLKGGSNTIEQSTMVAATGASLTSTGLLGTNKVSNSSINAGGGALTMSATVANTIEGATTEDGTVDDQILAGGAMTMEDAYLNTISNVVAQAGGTGLVMGEAGKTVANTIGNSSVTTTAGNVMLSGMLNSVSGSTIDSAGAITLTGQILNGAESISSILESLAPTLPDIADTLENLGIIAKKKDENGNYILDKDGKYTYEANLNLSANYLNGATLIADSGVTANADTANLLLDSSVEAGGDVLLTSSVNALTGKGVTTSAGNINLNAVPSEGLNLGAILSTLKIDPDKFGISEEIVEALSGTTKLGLNFVSGENLSTEDGFVKLTAPTANILLGSGENNLLKVHATDGVSITDSTINALINTDVKTTGGDINLSVAGNSSNLVSALLNSGIITEDILKDLGITQETLTEVAKLLTGGANVVYGGGLEATTGDVTLSGTANALVNANGTAGGVLTLTGTPTVEGEVITPNSAMANVLYNSTLSAGSAALNGTVNALVGSSLSSTAGSINLTAAGDASNLVTALLNSGIIKEETLKDLGITQETLTEIAKLLTGGVNVLYGSSLNAQDVTLNGTANVLTNGGALNGSTVTLNGLANVVMGGTKVNGSNILLQGSGNTLQLGTLVGAALNSNLLNGVTLPEGTEEALVSALNGVNGSVNLVYGGSTDVGNSGSASVTMDALANIVAKNAGVQGKEVTLKGLGNVVTLGATVGDAYTNTVTMDGVANVVYGGTVTGNSITMGMSAANGYNVLPVADILTALSNIQGLEVLKDLTQYADILNRLPSINANVVYGQGSAVGTNTSAVTLNGTANLVGGGAVVNGAEVTMNGLGNVVLEGGTVNGTTTTLDGLANVVYGGTVTGNSVTLGLTSANPYGGMLSLGNLLNLLPDTVGEYDITAIKQALSGVTLNTPNANLVMGDTAMVGGWDTSDVTLNGTANVVTHGAQVIGSTVTMNGMANVVMGGAKMYGTNILLQGNGDTLSLGSMAGALLGSDLLSGVTLPEGTADMVISLLDRLNSSVNLVYGGNTDVGISGSSSVTLNALANIVAKNAGVQGLEVNMSGLANVVAAGATVGDAYTNTVNMDGLANVLYGGTVTGNTVNMGLTSANPYDGDLSLNTLLKLIPDEVSGYDITAIKNALSGMTLSAPNANLILDGSAVTADSNVNLNGTLNLVAGGAQVTAGETVNMNGLANVVVDTTMQSIGDALTSGSLGSITEGGDAPTVIGGKNIVMDALTNVMLGDKVMVKATQNVTLSGTANVIGFSAQVSGNNVTLKGQNKHDTDLSSFLPAGLVDLAGKLGVADILQYGDPNLNVVTNGAQLNATNKLELNATANVVMGGADLKAGTISLTSGGVNVVADTTLQNFADAIQSGSLAPIVAGGKDVTTLTATNINLSAAANIVNGGKVMLDATEAVTMNGLVNVLSGNARVEGNNVTLTGNGGARINWGSLLPAEYSQLANLLNTDLNVNLVTNGAKVTADDRLHMNATANVVMGGAELNAKSIDLVSGGVNVVADTTLQNFADAIQSGSLAPIVAGGKDNTTLTAGNINLTASANIVNGGKVVLDATETVTMNGLANVISGNAQVSGKNVNMLDYNGKSIDWSSLLPEEYSQLADILGTKLNVNVVSNGASVTADNSLHMNATANVVMGGAELNAKSIDLVSGGVNMVVDTTLQNFADAIQNGSLDSLMAGGSETTKLTADHINLSAAANVVNGKVALDADKTVAITGAANMVGGNAQVEAADVTLTGTESTAMQKLVDVLPGEYGQKIEDLGVMELGSANVVMSGADVKAGNDVKMSGGLNVVTDATLADVMSLVDQDDTTQPGGGVETTVHAGNNVTMSGLANVVMGNKAQVSADNKVTLTGTASVVTAHATVKAGKDIELSSSLNLVSDGATLTAEEGSIVMQSSALDNNVLSKLADKFLTSESDLVNMLTQGNANVVMGASTSLNAAERITMDGVANVVMDGAELNAGSIVMQGEGAGTLALDSMLPESVKNLVTELGAGSLLSQPLAATVMTGEGTKLNATTGDIQLNSAANVLNGGASLVAGNDVKFDGKLNVLENTTVEAGRDIIFSGVSVMTNADLTAENGQVRINNAMMNGGNIVAGNGLSIQTSTVTADSALLSGTSTIAAGSVASISDMVCTSGTLYNGGSLEMVDVSFSSADVVNAGNMTVNGQLAMLETSLTFYVGTRELVDGGHLTGNNATISLGTGASLVLGGATTMTMAASSLDAITGVNFVVTVDELVNGEYTFSLDLFEMVDGSLATTFSTADWESAIKAGEVTFTLVDAAGQVLGHGTTTSVEVLTNGSTVTLNGRMTIPEPTTATLSLLALVGLAARRRRK